MDEIPCLIRTPGVGEGVCTYPITQMFCNSASLWWPEWCCTSGYHLWWTYCFSWVGRAQCAMAEGMWMLVKSINVGHNFNERTLHSMCEMLSYERRIRKRGKTWHADGRGWENVLALFSFLVHQVPCFSNPHLSYRQLHNLTFIFEQVTEDDYHKL